MFIGSRYILFCNKTFRILIELYLIVPTKTIFSQSSSPREIQNQSASSVSNNTRAPGFNNYFKLRGQTSIDYHIHLNY